MEKPSPHLETLMRKYGVTKSQFTPASIKVKELDVVFRPAPACNAIFWPKAW